MLSFRLLLTSSASVLQNIRRESTIFNDETSVDFQSSLGEYNSDPSLGDLHRYLSAKASWAFINHGETVSPDG